MKEMNLDREINWLKAYFHWQTIIEEMKTDRLHIGMAHLPCFGSLTYASHHFALSFVLTRNVDLAISLSTAMSIETLPSFQIVTTGDSDSM